MPYSVEHRQAVLDLHRHLMPRRRGEHERYFAWKYEENPYLPTPVMALVYHQSQLAAMRGIIGTRWVVPSRGSLTIPAAEDLIVAEAHRDRGLFLMIDKELRRLAADLGFPSIVSLSAGPTTQRLQEVAGWRWVRALDRSYRQGSEAPRRWRYRGKRLGQKLGLSHRKRPSDAFADRVLEGVADSSRYVQVSREPDIPSMVALSALSANGCSHERTAEFYRWRLRNPDRRYRFVYWRDPAPQGFVVLAMRAHNHHRVAIVDSAATSAEILTELLESLTRAHRPSYELFPSALPVEVQSHLAQMGFREDRNHRFQDLSFYESVTSEQLRSLTEAEVRWDVDMIDTMRA